MKRRPPLLIVLPLLAIVAFTLAWAISVIPAPPVLIVVGLAMIVGIFAQRIVMAPYWARACTGRAWRRAFPAASKQDIRDFLQTFVDGFGFPSQRRLCFLPTDEVMDVYQHIAGSADVGPEEFAIELEDRFDLKLESCWHERITLGEIFAYVMTPTKRSSPA